MTKLIQNPVSLRRFIFLAVLLTSVNVLAGSRVTPVDQAMQVDAKGCNVTIYQTPFAALKNGEIEEICIIEGTESGVRKTTAEKVIRKNAHEACGCGTNKAYLKSHSEPDGKSAHVVMVAFRYANEPVAVLGAVDPYESIKQKKSASRITNSSRTANAPRVFTDDFERVLRPVTQSQERPTVWLGQRSKTD